MEERRKEGEVDSVEGRKERRRIKEGVKEGRKEWKKKKKEPYPAGCFHYPHDKNPA